MTDVFISYSRKDSEFVHKLYNALSDNQRQAWVDWEKIPLSADWWATIQAGIEAADTFVFVISPDSVTSEVCNREVEHAVKNNKRLVPMVHREVMPNAMHQALAQHNWLFAREDDDFDATFDTLLKTIDTDLNYVQQHTRLLVRGREWEGKGRDPAYLLRGSDLETAEFWLSESGGKQPKPTEVQTQYIHASRRTANARQRALLAGTGIALAATIALAIAAIGLFSVAETRRQESDVRGTAVALNAATAIAAEATSERRADEWRALAWSVASERAGDTDDRDAELALALAAMGIANPPPQVQTQMRNAVQAPGTAAVWQGAHLGWTVGTAVSADNRWLLATSYDGAVSLTDLHTGAVVRTEQYGEAGEPIDADGTYLNIDSIYTVAFHPTRPTLAALGSFNGSVTLIDVSDWSTVGRLPDGPDGVNVVRFDPTGERLAVAYNRVSDGVVVYDAATLDPIVRLNGHDGLVNALSFSPDGARLVTGADDATARLWDAASGEAIRTYGPFSDTMEAIPSIMGLEYNLPQTSPDPIVYVALDSGLIHALDEATGAILFDFDTGNTPSTISAIALSPDGMTLFSGGYDGIGSYWDTRTGALIRTFRASTLLDSLMGVAYTRDGLSVIAGMQNGAVRRWYARSGAEVARMHGVRNGGSASVVALSADGALALVGGGEDDPAITVWDLATRSPVRRLEGHPDALLALDSWHDPVTGQHRVLSGGWDGAIRLWDADSGTELGAFDQEALFISTARFVRQGQHAGRHALITAVSFGGFAGAGVIDLDSGAIVQRFPEARYYLTLTAAFDAAEERVLVGGATIEGNGGFTLLDAASGEVIRAWEGIGASAVQRIAFSAAETGVTIATQDGQVIAYDIASGREVMRYPGHEDVVNDLLYSPDETVLFTISYDDTIRAWRAADGAPLLLLHLDDDGRDLAFGADGLLYSTSSDGALSAWAVELDAAEAARWAQTNRFVRDLTCLERQINGIPPLCP